MIASSIRAELNADSVPKGNAVFHVEEEFSHGEGCLSLALAVHREATRLSEVISSGRLDRTQPGGHGCTRGTQSPDIEAQGRAYPGQPHCRLALWT